MSIGRRRRVLIEKLLPTKVHKYEIKKTFIPLITPIQSGELFLKNNFIIELEMSNGMIIDEFRIRGFKLENNGGKKTLKVKTVLHVKEWLDEYNKVIVARITLNDVLGNEINSFDLDVQFESYSFECDYSSDGFMTPCFTYSIIED